MITNAEKRILLCDRDELRARRLALLLSKTSKDWNVLTIFEVKDWVEVLL